MDGFEDVCRQHSLVILSFLGHADQGSTCTNAEFQKELQSLGRDLNVSRDRMNSSDDGELETDGHLISNIKIPFGDIEPEVELHVPVDAEAMRVMIAELIEIADQYEHHVVNRATENLVRKLVVAPIKMWKVHLTLEVEWIVKHSLGVGLRNLPQERVIMALALTLVKGVCVRAPRMMRNLFDTILRYLSPTTAS